MSERAITADDILISYVLECDRCAHLDESDGFNERQATLEFNENGWKIIDGDAVCSWCQKDGQ